MKEKQLSIPRNTLAQAKQVLKGWEELKDEMTVPNLSIEEFKTAISEAEKLIDIADEYKEKQSQAIKARNNTTKEVWEFTKSVRNAGKATFGDNSEEVELLGVNTVNSMRRRKLERLKSSE